ncbi:U3 small nucleolar RNA-associated protein 5 [Impatiens glandulifera]|uniref:U3 small nucleolar RNA-associated protein 5 n=1 Tax=Impatiens glandulifera TaxID=253017 RepID=UPI001FB13A00|nr:U3 small nucleolar RNA-associated protein 5 [Impatiens glandulifera]
MGKGRKAEMVIQNSAEEDQLVADDSQDNGLLEVQEPTPLKTKKSKKKRVASDLDDETTVNLEDIGNIETAADGSQIDDDITEPTMGEKIASLNLVNTTDDRKALEEDSIHQTKPPSADSMHVLVKQALQANDRALLWNCLNIQDERVITNSVSLLNPSDVMKLLDALISVIHYRGAGLARALPWLRSLLLQHASGIASQESSLVALNSMYQLIEARVSNFHSALQLSSSLDLNFSTIVDDSLDDDEAIRPVIYEDKDSDDEESEGSEEDAMETDDDTSSLGHEAEDGDSDIEGSDGMGI